MNVLRRTKSTKTVSFDDIMKLLRITDKTELLRFLKSYGLNINPNKSEVEDFN